MLVLVSGSESKIIHALPFKSEKLLDTVSPGLPEANRQVELRYHLLNALPDKVALQLKLLPKVGYHDTISKARELLLLFRRAEMPTTNVNHLLTSHNEERLRGVEEALQQMSQQLELLRKKSGRFGVE